MDDINSFFIPENKVDAVPESYYGQKEVILNTLMSINRLTHKSIYIIDLYRKNFLYVSKNPIFLCGYNPDEVQEMGYNFYFKIVPKDDMGLLLKINRVGFQFFDQTPIEDRMGISASFDYHIMNKGKLLLVNQKITPIMLAKNGRIWLAACVVSLSDHHDAGNLEIHFEGKSDFLSYSMGKEKWQRNSGYRLKEREREILRLYPQGLTEAEIAEKLCIDKNTVKYHKRSLFEKLGVKSISTALSVAYENKLI